MPWRPGLTADMEEQKVGAVEHTILTIVGITLSIGLIYGLNLIWRAARPCVPGDKECIGRLYQNHPVRTPAFWRDIQNQPLDARIGPAPPELVEYISLDAQLQDFPVQPRATTATPDFLADVRAAVAEMPPKIRTILERRLIGIWLVDDIGGSGLTDLVGWGRAEGAAFVVLDPTQLAMRRANEWATWKEGTPFKPDSKWRIDARIAEDRNNTRKEAILYILLHEIGHVVGTRGDIHPRWDRPSSEVGNGSLFSFYSLSWRMDPASSGHRTIFEASYPDRAKVTYYFGANLEGSEMQVAYRWLQSTNFPSLYAATNPGDDFAESFVTYVHTELMQRPWSISVLREGETVQVLHACWRETRCAEKRKILEAIIESESGGSVPPSATAGLQQTVR